MSIELPPELGWVAKLAVGQDWPKGDEDKLRSLGAAWDDAARQLTAISREIDPATSGVLHSVGGQVADEFTAFTQQLKSNIPDMAEAAGQLGELGRNTGLQVEYAKYMIIAQLVWLAVEIAELAFWAPEAIPALVTGVRVIVKMLLKRLLVSIATGVGFMVGMDAVIQGIQFLKGDRTKWDTAATLQALEGGAIGGAIGGLFSGAGSAFAPKFASSLIGKGVIGGASSIVTTEVMSQIFGGENDMGSALTSGIIGAMGGGGGRRRFGGGEHTEVHTPDIHLPSEPDLHLPKLSFDGEGDGPHLPGTEDFETKGLGSGSGSGLGDKGAGTGGGTGSVKTLDTGGGRTGDESGNATAHTAAPQTATPHTTVTESGDPVTGGTRKTATTPHVATETTSSPHTSTTDSRRTPATDYGTDEVAPRAPRAQQPTGQNQAPTTGGQNESPTTGGQHESPTTGGQNQSPTTTEPHQSAPSTEPSQPPTTEHTPTFPDVPRHEPGTTPHLDTAESATPDPRVTEQLHQLDSVVVPTHDPNPLHQAPAPPTARPVAPDAGIRQRVSDLDRAARGAGMSEADRTAHTRAVDKAVASGDWQRAGEHLSAFRAHVETRTTQQRYDAFHAHAQGGFDRLTNFTGSRQEWQSKVDAVEQAHGSGDSELLDSRLNEYASYVEHHVPAESLTGNDTPRPFHQDVEDLRQRLALTTDQPTADRLRAQLDATRQDAELHDRLVQLRSTSDPGTTALHERLDNARTPDEANQALHELEQRREEQRLQQRLDHLKSDEPTPDRPPAPGSEADLRRRLDALDDGADEHERELRERVDQAATPQVASRALHDLHEYRADRQLQQRLDRLKSDVPDHPSERELRERLDALHDGEDDPRAAELRRRVQEARTEPEAREALDKLDQHLRDREQARQDRAREFGDRMEQLREQHTEQLLGLREGAPEDTSRRIEDIRTELSSHLTYDERTSTLRQELARPTVAPESPGHLDRITAGTDEHTKAVEDTAPAPRDALKVPADHTPVSDSTDQHAKATAEPQQAARQPGARQHEGAQHEVGQLQAQKERPHEAEDPAHPSQHPVPGHEHAELTSTEKPQEQPKPQEKQPDPVLDGRHVQGLAGKKITEEPGPDAVRARVETLLGGHAGDTSVAQRLDAALDPANFRKQHAQMVNGGWRFTVHVDGKPYEVEVKATASAWRLDPTKDAAKDNDGDGFDVPVESTHERDPRKTEMTSSEAGLEFGPTVVRPVNPQLSALITPSGKLGGATHGRETTVKSATQTANQFAFTGKTDSYTSDFTYQVKVTDHQGTPLHAPGADGEIKGQVRADVPRPLELDKHRPRTWQGWDPDQARNRANRPASGHPVSITSLDTARDAVYQALPREARPDGTAHQDIEDFFQPSNVINEFEHASGPGLLSKPLTLSDGGKAHLLLTVEPDGSRALHTVDDKATLGAKSTGEHGQSRTENSSWSLGLSGGATGEVWKATDGGKESTWLTGTAGYTGSSNLAHGVKGKNAIGTESSREHTGKADLVATGVRLRVQLIRHHFRPGPDGLHSTTATKIGDHSPPPTVRQPAPAPGDVVLTIDPQHGEVLRAVPHELPQVTTGGRPQLEPARLTDPVAAPRTTILDVPGSTELEDHIVREMHQDHPGVLPPPEAIRPGTGTETHPRVTPEAWQNLRALRQQLAPSRLRGAGSKLLDGTYRITLKSPHLPGRSGTTHEILIKAEPGKGDHQGSGKSTTKAVQTRTTGADKSVTRSTKHVVNLAGNVRSSLDHPDVTRGFTIGSLDITAHNPSHGITMGAETEVKRQFSLEADTDTYAHPVTFHVMLGVEDPEQPTTHLSTVAPSPHMQHIKQVRPDGRLTVEVARTPEPATENPPPTTIPKAAVLPQRHAIRHVTASDDFRNTARQSLTSAFQKKAGGSTDTRVPELKDALDGLTDEDHLRSLVSASHGGWANSGDEQVGSGRNRDTVGLSTRTRLSAFRFRETLPGEGKLEIETKSSVSTAVADKNTRGFKAGLGFDAARFPSKDSPDAALQVRGGVKGKGGAGMNSGENVKQKMTTSRKAAYKGTWHLYEADADVTVQGRVTDAKGNTTLGDPQHSKHRVLVLLSDDDVRHLGDDPAKAPDTTGTRQATLLAHGLLGGATAEIPRSDEILGEIDRQIRGLDQVSDVPESALPFADTFSPENLSANYEELVGRGILDYHVHESRTQRVVTEVLVRGVPRDEWADEGDHSTGDTTRKVGLAETVKGSAGHNWSLGADGNFRISYAPVVKPKPGEDAAAVKAEENKSGLGNAAWAPSGGAEGSRSKSAETGVTTKVEHKTSKFGDTVRFGNRMRFEVTVTRRTEYGRFVNLVKPRPVEPDWRVHVDVPKSLTKTAEQTAADQQNPQTQHDQQTPTQQPPPEAQPQVLDGGGTVEMRPLVSTADRERWQASLDSAHDLVGFDNHAGLYDQARTVLTTPRPWGEGVLGKTGAAISWGLGSAATTIGHWAGTMTPEAATKLLGSFVSDPRLDADHPLVGEQRLPLEQQVSLRRALGAGTLPTVFHQLKDPANGYRTVSLGGDGRTGLQVRLEPTGDAEEISVRDDGSDEITVATEHESATSASNGLNASLTPLAVPVTTKNPSVVVPMPTNALKLDRDQTFESSSPVTRAPGVPTRTLPPPALPHGTTATEPGKATLKGPQVLMRQPVRLSTQKYDENGTYGNTAHTDGHVYYWTAKKTEDTSTSTSTTAPTSTTADTTTSQDATPPKETTPSKDTTPSEGTTTTTDTKPATDTKPVKSPPATDTKRVKSPEETKQQDTAHKPTENPAAVGTHEPTETHKPVGTHKPDESHESAESPETLETRKPAASHEAPEDHTPDTPDTPPQPRVPVPGDGRCLLYSVLASTPPEHWPSALHGGTAEHARAQHEAVVHQIRTQHGRVGADSPLGRAARDLHQMVLDRVRSSRPEDLPFDVTELYRRSQENQLRQTLQSESFEQLRQRLHDTGVDHVISPDWLSPQALRTLYVDTRAQELMGPPHRLAPRDAADRAAAEVPETTDAQGRWWLRDDALAPRAQFAYVAGRTGPLSLDHVDSHDRLAGAVVDTALHQPLTPAEHQALIRAVRNWVPGNDAWNTDEGEMFPALVAHTLGIRLRTFQSTGDGTAHLRTVGPRNGNHTVDIYYNGRNHYDASRTPAHPTTATAPPEAKPPRTDEVAPKAPKAPEAPASTMPRRPLNRAPRFVVRSAFDARAFRVGDTPVTDLTVRIAFRDGSGHDPDTAWHQLVRGTDEFYNSPGHRLPNGSLLHVTVERVPVDADPHLVVDLAGRDRPMDQRTWWPDAEPVAYAHELGHQLGLRDEYREDTGAPGRAQVAGSLLGDFHQPAPHGLAQGGLRGRHLQLLGALVGDVPESVAHTGGEPSHTVPTERDPRWQQARDAAEPVTRRHVWVDPVTDPAADSAGEHLSQDPRMPRSEDSVEHGDEDELDWSDILQEYTRERRLEYAWLDGLYGETLDPQSYDRAHDALLTLQSMDLAHPVPDAEHQPHLELLARQVLHLDGPPSPDDYRYLLALTAHAGPESTRDAAALGAHYLATEHGALDHHTALVDASGQTTGRDWTGTRAVPPDLSSYTVSGPDGAATEHPAPWRRPYVVTALGTPRDGLSLLVDGRTVRVSGPAEFAELVARDPLRDPGQDILLLVSHAQDQGLAQLVADRAGTAVWSTDAEVRPTLDWRTGTERLDLSGGDGGWTLHMGDARGPLDLFDFGSPAPEHDPGGPDYAAKLLPHPGGDTSPLTPANLLDRLGARPLTTSDYEVIGAEPGAVLFEEPTGMRQTGFDYGPDGSGDVPRLIVPTQGHQQTLVSEHPPLHVSGDLSLAHRQGGYGQQVFASPKAIESANHQLALAGSLVRLEPGEMKLRVGDGQGGRRELVRVTPRFLTRSGKSEEEICRDFAQMVSGNVAASHVVFRSPDGTGLAKAPINALGRTEVTGIHHLAESLGLVADGQKPGTLDPSWAARQVRRDDRFIAESDGPTPGKSYGSALSYDPLDNPRRDNLSAAAREIGINEHAWAKVGEAYLVHSINALDEEGLPSLAHNYAKPGEPPGSHFGYHFAAVVLASEDGRHQITLENFARRAHVAAIVKSAVAHNLRQTGPDGFHRLHEAIADELDSARTGTADATRTKRLERHLALADALAKAADAREVRDATAAGSPERTAAGTAYDKAVMVAEARMKQAAELSKGSDLWHFRMFSQRPGETMHEVSADLLTSDPSAEANPLTSVIVHGHRMPRVDIEFREGSRQISRDEGRKLNYVAELATRAGLWNHHNGLPLPRITVTGRGNARRPTLGGVLPEAARQRAEAVHGELRDRLDRYLINYQHGSSQGRLTAADFPLEVTTERATPGGDRTQGRRTTVAVDDPHPEDTPTGTATTPRRSAPDPSEAAPRAPRAPQPTAQPPEDHRPTAPEPAPAPAPQPAAPPPSSYRSERLTIGGVGFADGSAELTGAQRETVHRLAAEVAWAAVANTRAGYPPPRVLVVGHANGMRGGLPHFGEALRRGQARADGVAEVFRAALAVHLARLQAGGEAVTRLADIEVTTRSEGNAPPLGAPAEADAAATRRQAFIVVELPRPGEGDAG
ncbi:hypothetical protein [Streptomyces sp. AM6-12]|uniref:WXG100-like domain-containing protein n=1 Tax=Streptomyces sp. AM6-12 TaxID=3345149 RepID=UPI00379ED6A1